MFIKNYNKFLESKSGKLYEYGCVMVYLDMPNWESITSYIDEEDLYKPENKRYGLETEPHLTVLYGLHSDVNDQDVLNVFKDVKSSDIQLDILGIDIFENKQFDVVKMNVKSETLNNLNAELRKLPHTSDYPDYKPHITIAYLLPGRGKKYIEPDYKFKFNQVKKVIYSKANGQKIEMEIN
jgi:2'-5' RNA ligase